MEKATEVKKPMNTKGGAISKKMLDELNAWREHLKKGGTLENFKRDETLR